ncbi:MAG: xanthine dehydrogenase family protein subunit M [Chloroflexi bacterium]|nr:xanthine dehydrogenase family protein subunit M [Chloroflexota bacterium]
MQPVKYARAATLDEAVAMLSENGRDAYVLAGGTDLIVTARERTHNVDLFVDVKHIPEVMSISFDDAGLTIGTAVPCYKLYNDERIVADYPAIVDSASLIGGTAIQGRASFGGNLCNSGPAADSIPTQIVLQGSALIAGPNGRREVAVEDFCTGPGSNVLERGELLVAIRFPAPQPNSGAAFERFIPRNEMDIAVVNAACSLQIDGGTVSNARISIGAVAATPLYVPAAGDALNGSPLSDETIAAAASAAQEAATPIDDMRGSIKQRKHLVAVLTERVIRTAAGRV